MTYSTPGRVRAFIILAVAVFSLVSAVTQAQKRSTPTIQVGAYYFDGWTGRTPMHMPRALIDSFPEREPVWGWLTSSPKVLQYQIDAAADAGLSFFSFCWYFSTDKQGAVVDDPKNHALSLYLKAANKDRLKFCLLVANHQGHYVGPADWAKVSQAWLQLFKEPTHLQVNGRPLLIFFSASTLVSQFGSTQAVRQAFDSLRVAAVKSGLAGVTIAACASPNSDAFRLARECGFDLLTGYNYHSAGFKPPVIQTPIDSMAVASRRIWDQFKTAPVPYIPTVTLNWDPRPWANLNKAHRNAPRYIGFSPNSVFKDVQMARQWIEANPGKTPKEKIALLYAWNEYGEGAWLTPSRNGKENPLTGVKKALKR